MAAIIEFKSDEELLSHPAVGAIQVHSKQAGQLPVQDVVDALVRHSVDTKLLPSHPTPATALKRACEKYVVTNNQDRRVRLASTGPRGHAIHSLLHLDRDRIADDQDEGQGVADLFLRTKLEVDGVGRVSPVFSAECAASEAIREMYYHNLVNYTCSKDLSIWLTQTIYKAHNAFQRPGNGGSYYVAMGKDYQGLMQVRDALHSISTYSNDHGATRLLLGVKMYVSPVFSGMSDVADALTDALIDEWERVEADINKYLNTMIVDGRKLQASALEKRMKTAADLDSRMRKFTASCNLSTLDMEPRIKALNKRISQAQLISASL